MAFARDRMDFLFAIATILIAYGFMMAIQRVLLKYRQSTLIILTLNKSFNKTPRKIKRKLRELIYFNIYHLPKLSAM